MKQYASDIAFTKSVKAIQTRQGSRDSYARVEKSWWPDRITPELVDFILERDSFYTVYGQKYLTTFIIIDLHSVCYRMSKVHFSA